MVAKRGVVVTAGKASISCRQVTTFLSTVFENVLRQSVNEAAKILSEDLDERMEYLFREIRHAFHSHVMKRHIGASLLGSATTFRADDVSKLSAHFPLCFRRVYGQLVREHRLQHHARVAFTLFLKEIGLPRHEAVTFWSSFYSRDAAQSCTSCCHSWDKDERKFLYRFCFAFVSSFGLIWRHL